MVWGLVVWIPRIPLWKGLLLRGTPESQTTNPNHHVASPEPAIRADGTTRSPKRTEGRVLLAFKDGGRARAGKWSQWSCWNRPWKQVAKPLKGLVCAPRRRMLSNVPTTFISGILNMWTTHEPFAEGYWTCGSQGCKGKYLAAPLGQVRGPRTSWQGCLSRMAKGPVDCAAAHLDYLCRAMWDAEQWHPLRLWCRTVPAPLAEKMCKIIFQILTFGWSKLVKNLHSGLPVICKSLDIQTPPEKVFN